MHLHKMAPKHSTPIKDNFGCGSFLVNNSFIPCNLDYSDNQEMSDNPLENVLLKLESIKSHLEADEKQMTEFCDFVGKLQQSSTHLKANLDLQNKQITQMVSCYEDISAQFTSFNNKKEQLFNLYFQSLYNK
ncbi:hypothetical protein CHUAL_013068 [Chamberlinius hualienensis]